MPRPTNKALLLSESQKEHELLEQLLAPLSAEQMCCPGVLGEWAVKDVLAHLSAWEQMVLSWYQAGLRGEKPIVPSEDYKWNQLPALNQHIYETYRDWPIEDILTRFRESYHQVMTLIESLSDEELFTPGRYRWANRNALGAYLVSCTSSHYYWARTEIRKGLKNK